MIKRLQIFLGPSMTRAFIAWFALTGFVSLVLNSMVSQYDWVRPVQSLIVLLFILGTVLIFGSRLPPGERGRWVGILLPAFIALLLAVFVLPQFAIVLIGGGLGWIVVSMLLGRNQMPVEYREAVKHLRKSEYDKAAKVMDQIINAQPAQPNHYRFRAEIYRLWGKIKLAIRDYQKMAEIEPRSPVAYNGLAEVYLQNGDYDKAQEAANKASQLAPGDWVTYYNLGMIEDRLKESDQVIGHLKKALALKANDKRHLLLIHLYLARAYSRSGQMTEAENEIKSLKKYVTGLEEWQTILESDQAETLRKVIGQDVELALGLVDGSRTVASLVKST